MTKYNSRVIFACDFESREQLLDFLKAFGKEKLFLKLGMEIIYQEGFSLIEELKNLGHNIFLDLKLLDIPNTVSQALKALVKYNVDLISIHSLGGAEMLKEAQEVVKNTSTKLLAISILTSLDNKDLTLLGFKNNVPKTISNLVSLASKNGIAGMVASAFEAPFIKKQNMLAVTPGIRLQKNNYNDQKRVVDVKEALRLGADLLVIGRSITMSKQPYQTYLEIIKIIKEEENEKNS